MTMNMVGGTLCIEAQGTKFPGVIRQAIVGEETPLSYSEVDDGRAAVDMRWINRLDRSKGYRWRGLAK